MGFIDVYEPTIDVDYFTDIPLDELTAPEDRTIDLVMSDIEGTVLVRGTTEVPDDILVERERIRQNGAFFVLITNKRDADYAEEVASIMSADGWYVPVEKAHRKADPHMLNEAMSDHGVVPARSMMIGDKHTSDVAAGNNAGVAITARVRRLGPPSSDHKGDLLLRRPVESGIIRPTISVVKMLRGISERAS